MLDGMFVFDAAVHVVDFSDEALRPDRSDAVPGRDWVLRLGKETRWEGYNKDINFAKRWTIEEAYDWVFVDAPTDMAMAMVVPTWFWWKDGAAPVATQHAFAEQYPDRVVFCGGVDPLSQGVDVALDQLDYQVKELGAVSIKFYNAHPGGGWRCDDEKLAYPLYERCLALGVKNVQFHKGAPFGLMNIEELRPNDIQAPARDYPDLTFIIHHLGVPYFDETVSIASRFPNVTLSLGLNMNMCVVAPRLIQDQLGRLLMEVGADKLYWASDAVLSGGPRPYLEAFGALEIPEDLRDGFGYPQITREDKAKILGLNFARLLGIDAEAKVEELYGLTV